MAILPHDFTKFTLQRCQGIFFPEGKELGYNMLSMSKVTLTPSFSYIDVKAYDDAQTKKVDQILTEKGVDISITMDEKNDVSWHAGNASNDITTFNSQTAGSMQTFTVPEADVWFHPTQPGVYQIRDSQGQPVQNISTLVITYGLTAAPAAVTLTAGTHYNYNPLTGLFWLLAKPGTVVTETDLTLTYTKAVVDVSHRLIDVGGLSGDGLKGRLALVGVNVGFLWRLDINLCRLVADGDNEFQNTDDIGKTNLKGPILAVDHLNGVAIPEKYQFYRMQQLLNPA